MTDRKAKLGLPSGSLIHMGRVRHDVIELRVLDYNEFEVREFDVLDPCELQVCRERQHTSWINVDGVHDAELMQKIGEQFQLHPLLLEDLMNPFHRPKIEDFDDYVHFTLKMLSYNQQEQKVESEQVSFVLGNSWVLSFQETPGDVFDPIRERIRNSKGRIRKGGADYLAYALADIIVDHYFIVLEEIEKKIERLESDIMRDKEIDGMREIQNLKKELMFLRKNILPIRDAMGNLMTGSSELIHEKTIVFLKDVYDHTIQLSESLEIYREMLNSLMEVHLSAQSNRLNKVMKVLTIISTIFIPLTFIVGVYGMNFKFMPELGWEYGYAMVWGIMIAVTITLLIILKRKKWM